MIYSQSDLFLRCALPQLEPWFLIYINSSVFSLSIIVALKLLRTYLTITYFPFKVHFKNNEWLWWLKSQKLREKQSFLRNELTISPINPSGTTDYCKLHLKALSPILLIMINTRSNNVWWAIEHTRDAYDYFPSKTLQSNSFPEAKSCNRTPLRPRKMSLYLVLSKIFRRLWRREKQLYPNFAFYCSLKKKNSGKRLSGSLSTSTFRKNVQPHVP